MQIRNKLYSILCVLLLFGCAKKEPPRPSPALQLRSLGQLATTEYELAKVIRARDEGTWYKVGDRRMLITCRAIIKAGIDLSQVRDMDISSEGSSLTVTLPPPQILSFSLPPENIRVAYTDVGPLRDPFSQSETIAVLQQAEKQIRRQADSLQLLPQAAKNATLFIKQFFEQAGYTEVNVKFRYSETAE